MGTHDALEPMWLNLIDERCDRFERAWQHGEAPELAAHLADVPGGAAAVLLRELLVIELDHRKDKDGRPVSAQKMLDLHPQLRTRIEAALEEMAPRDISKAAAADIRDQAPTIAHTPGRDSRGLHIRCPHCHNPVELLADTPFEDVTCYSCGSTFSLVKREMPTQLAETLEKIGRFELISRLGVGGFGTVWKARDTELDRTVSIKIPRKGQLDEKELEQFFREARAAAQLKHPNIVPVHEVGRERDTIFVVADFVRGVSLSDWLTGQQPSARDTAELCAKVADALHHAHQHGVIHRDLKPSNIMIDEHGEPHIMDFGLAKREIGEITITVDGQILGTPAYMAPEQAKGHSHWADRRTDIYSSGVVIFQLLTGELPFRGNAQMQIHQVITDDAPNPRKLNGHIPQDMATICLKCLEKDPNKRYATAKELADELRRFLRGEPIEARPISALSKAWRWSKRNPALAAAIGLATFLAIAGPAAALHISAQRKQLSEELAQKERILGDRDRTIDRAAEDGKSLRAQLAERNARLAAWENGANPTNFWPPYETSPPSKQIIEIIIDKSDLEVSKMLKVAQGDEQATFVHLALALMFEELNRNEKALQHFRQAKVLLEQLAERHPTQNRYVWALADCSLHLAALCVEDDREEAISQLEESMAIHEGLARFYHDTRLLTHRLEGEQRLLVARGYSSGRDALAHVMRLSRGVSASSDPLELYRVACYLCRSAPILSDTLLTERD